MTRAIHEVAADIRRSWPNVHPAAAVEALDALSAFELVTDYGAREAILEFLPNARFFAGIHARRLKAELHTILNSEPTRGQFLRRSQMAARRQLQLLRESRAEAAP